MVRPSCLHLESLPRRGRAHQKLCREISLECIPVNLFANRPGIEAYRRLDPTVYCIDDARTNQEPKDLSLRPSHNHQLGLFNRKEIQAPAIKMHGYSLFLLATATAASVTPAHRHGGSSIVTMVPLLISLFSESRPP